MAFAGCDGSVEPGEPVYLEVLEVTVGPPLAKCYGVGPRSCMVGGGELFYDGIEGFVYEAGYDYRLRIGKYDPWGGRGPPQDAGRYAYRLLEQLEKTPCQRRSKRSQLWRLKMSHPAGGDEPQIVAASRRLRVRLG